MIDNLNKTLLTQHILYVKKPLLLYSSNSSNTKPCTFKDNLIIMSKMFLTCF